MSFPKYSRRILVMERGNMACGLLGTTTRPHVFDKRKSIKKKKERNARLVLISMKHSPLSGVIATASINSINTQIKNAHTI